MTSDDPVGWHPDVVRANLGVTFGYRYNMGNSVQSRRNATRATRIPEATAVPVAHTSGTILMEQRLAEQTEEIKAQRAELNDYALRTCGCGKSIRGWH